MKTFVWSAIMSVTFVAAGAALAAVPAERAAESFELPRLKVRGNPHDESALARTKATVDELSPGANASVRTAASGNLAHLVIDGGKSWSRPLRGGPKDTTFVSFFVYAADGTVIDVAGVRLRVRAGTKPGFAQLQFGYTAAKSLSWVNFGGPVAYESHGGHVLAALPVLTVRLDRRAGVWDLFVANRLVLADQSLGALPRGAPNQFTVHAGSAGAMVSGLVSADENPLFDDENGNGIDDAFELRQRGAVNGHAQESAADRRNLARQWQQDQQQHGVRPWLVQRPLPDGAPAVPPLPAKKK